MKKRPENAQETLRKRSEKGPLHEEGHQKRGGMKVVCQNAHCFDEGGIRNAPRLKRRCRASWARRMKVVSLLMTFIKETGRMMKRSGNAKKNAQCFDEGGIRNAPRLNKAMPGKLNDAAGLRWCALYLAAEPERGAGRPLQPLRSALRDRGRRGHRGRRGRTAEVRGGAGGLGGRRGGGAVLHRVDGDLALRDDLRIWERTIRGD